MAKPKYRMMCVVQEFVAWEQSAGQGRGTPLGYIPMPANVAAQAQSALCAIE